MASHYREMKKQQAKHATMKAQAVARGRLQQQSRAATSSDSGGMASTGTQLRTSQSAWPGSSWLGGTAGGASGIAVPSYADAVRRSAFHQGEFPRKRTAPAIMEGIPSMHLTQEEGWLREVEDMQEQGKILGGGPLHLGSGLSQTPAQANLEVNPFFRSPKVETRTGHSGMGMQQSEGSGSDTSSRLLPSNEGEESTKQSLVGAGQGTHRRRLTTDEVQLCTTLHVKGLPSDQNTPGVLRGHFAAFGEITNLQCFPERKYATVEFRTNDQAVQAKKFGRTVNKRPVQLFWHTPRGRGMGQRGTVYPGGGRGRGVAGGRGRGVSIPPVGRTQQRPTLTPYTPPSSVVSSSSQEDSSVLTESSIPVVGGGVERAGGSVFSRLGGRSQASGSQVAAMQEEGYYGDEGGEVEFEEGEIMFEEGSGRGERFLPVHHVQYEGYFPNEEDQEQIARDREEDRRTEAEAVREGRLEVPDHSHEMDTVARFAEHPYHLRSLHRGGVGQQQDEGVGQEEKEEQGSFKAKDLSLQSVLLLSSLPLPSHPQGAAAKDLYDALEERDQQMRQMQVKGKTLHQAGTLVGVCPDMCPEKERYLREYQRRLSKFEMVPGTEGLVNPAVDHSTAVKEYSKSAADQEVSLSHDVRPPSTLQLTMDYLVVKIVNLYGQVAHGDWYDFLWDRMRSVRKDITLQHLCTPDTVDLVEKCARFHILCGYLLCEEKDLSVYDPAINQEHIMKCLQSQIEAYRDLRQQGEVCPNEAEFCGYDILLHLTSGDVLNRLAKYSDAVRSTPPVQFAVKALHAVTSSNFVRFFKLVRSATFLNACILHRYFPEIRSSALSVLNHTHSTPNQAPHIMPLVVLQRMLAIDPQQTAALCSHHGIEVVGGSVVYRRGAFTDVGSFPATLEPHLVDTKRSGSYGEVVYGGPLRPLPVHTPYLSFSQHGTPRDVSKKHILPLPDETSHVAVDDLLTYVVGEQVVEVCREQVEVEQDEQAAALGACQELIEGVVSKEALIISQESLTAATAERDMQMKVIGEEMELAYRQIMESVIDVETKTVTLETIDEAIYQVAHSDALQAVHGLLLEGVMTEEVTTLAREVVQTCKRERRTHLERLRGAVVKLVKGRVLRRWRRQLKERQRVCRAEQTFPAWGSTLPLSEQVEALCGTGTGSGPHPPAFQTARWLLREELNRASKETAELRRVSEGPLDVVEVLHPFLLNQMKTCVSSSAPSSDWCLMVLNPAGAALGGEVWKWLLRKFGQSEEEVQSCDNQVVLLQTVQRDIPQEMASLEPVCRRCRLRVAVKAFAGPVSTLTASDLKGTSAIFMLLPWQHTKELSSTLLSLDTLLLPHPPLPVVVTCLDQRTASLAHQNTQSLRLGAVSCVKVETLTLKANCAPTMDAYCQLLQGVQWMASNSLRLQDICGQRLREFVEAGMVELFVKPAMNDDRTRRQCGAPPQDALTVLTLYNSAVSHLANAASHGDLSLISYPCRELERGDSPAPSKGVPPLHWNTSSQLEHLEASITQLHLLVASLPQPSQDWSIAAQDCVSYFKSWLVANGNTSPLLLTTRIDSVLQMYKEEWSRPASSWGDVPPIIALPWAKLVSVFAQYAIHEMDPDTMVWLPWQQFGGAVRAFQVPVQWHMGVSHTAECVDVTALEEKERRRRLLRSGLKRSTSDPVNVARPKRQSDSSEVHSSAADTLHHTKKLKSELECEHRLSDKFEKELRGLLEGGVPEIIPHPLLLSAHQRLSPCTPHSTAPKSHALLTTPLPTRKSLGDQVDWVVQELASLKRQSGGLDRQLQTLAQPP